MDHAHTPLLSALKKASKREHAAFYAPGHRRGQGAFPSLKDLLGSALQADLPELPELDNLFAPEGPIQTAQILAADAFGAEQTWLLANGSTCGIEAALLAAIGPGETVIVPRNAHQSIIFGLILSGAIPVFVQPTYDPAWDMAYGISPAAIAAALDQHSNARAVLVVSPTYHGVCSDLATIAQIVHDHGIPLLVDEAHGPHFGFHPELPKSALEANADLVVQSTHKVLSALTQASMLHVQGTRIDRQRLERSLRMTQSSSPNYLLLASLDAARAQIATVGETLMDHTLAIAKQVRACLEGETPFQVLTAEAGAHLPGFHDLDLTRLTVDVSRVGWDGFAADACLHERFGVTAELPTLRCLTFILTLGSTEQDGQRLVQGLAGLLMDAPAAKPLEFTHLSQTLPSPVMVLSPREAFFALVETMPIQAALGRACADVICPYPPGIPILLPGEMVTEAAIAYLDEVHRRGGHITGLPEVGLAALRVVR